MIVASVLRHQIESRVARPISVAPGAPKSGAGLPFLSVRVQATAAWTWFNYICSRVPLGKQVLRMNLDETAVCLFQGGGRGNLFISKKQRVVQHVPRNKKRCHLTHVALVCDNTDVQHLLPQLIIGNESSFLVSRMSELREDAPPNVVLVRQRSAWIDQQLCARLIRRVGSVLSPFRDRFQPVLLMDAHRAHIAQAVLNACRRAGIWVLIVPPQTTGVLQPLDTHGFKLYKDRMKKEYQTMRASRADICLPVSGILQCMYAAIRCVLNRLDWPRAFDATGFGQNQRRVSLTVRSRLGTDGDLQQHSRRPDMNDLALCLPKRTVITPDSLLPPREDVPLVVVVPARSRDDRVACIGCEVVPLPVGVPLMTPPSARFRVASLGRAPSRTHPPQSSSPLMRSRTRSQSALQRSNAFCG